MINDVGANLKNLRTSEGLTLRELASRTGLSATLLSQLERGVTEPTLRTLRALSTVFGREASALFAGPISLPIHVSRPGERSKLISPAGQIQYERITPNNGQFEVLRGTLEPGDWSSEDAWAHEAIECVYVTGGTLTVEVDGKAHVIREEESITFSAALAHRYGNEGDTPTVFILSVSPPTP